MESVSLGYSNYLATFIEKHTQKPLLRVQKSNSEFGRPNLFFLVENLKLIKRKQQQTKAVRIYPCRCEPFWSGLALGRTVSVIVWKIKR